MRALVATAVLALASLAAPRVARAQVSPGDDTAADGADGRAVESAPPSLGPDTLDPAVAARVRGATVRLRVDRAVQGGRGGLAVLVGSDGLLAMGEHALGDVGIGCPVLVDDGAGGSHEGLLVEVDNASDTALVRAAVLAGHVGLRVAAHPITLPLRVFVPTPDGVGFVSGTVRAAAREGLTLDLPPTPPLASGGPVVDAEGRVVGLLQRPLGGSSPAYATPVVTLRRMVATTHRDVPIHQCAPSYGGALPPEWHLGIDLGTTFSTLDTLHPLYSARATATYFQRWYVQFGAGFMSRRDLSLSLSGGPVLFRTRNDGMIAIGARGDVEFGPVDAFNERREFYGIEAVGHGYLAPRLAISVTLSGGVERRLYPPGEAAQFGGCVGLSVGLVYRVNGY